MYNLIAKGYTLIAIVQDREKIKRVCEVRQIDCLDSIDFLTWGVSYFSVQNNGKMTKKDFIKKCTDKEVYFIKPIF
jgi:hypothetical protein